ncbi:MAG TPA: wax ester/triacylglycerol synthase family O-acyltransferase, partial [Acidimicrobiaceae bacterium]|nr:wax ester/triacylglycerol synthase family O-acyltransferase [Acidimicrobiaceae bacterium]
VTVNDVVLGMCAGALRSYLDKHGELPEESLRCLIPVSVRTDDEALSYGNRVSGMLAALATDVADPIERLHVIHAETLRAKESLGALPADLLTDVAEFAPPAIFARASRVMARTAIANRIDPPFNLIISNVPGPQFPLYAGGAEMLSYIPVSAVADTQGLNMTIMSYNGRCDFGLVACRDAVPDLWVLCHLLEDALAELQDVAGVR